MSRMQFLGRYVLSLVLLACLLLPGKTSLSMGNLWGPAPGADELLGSTSWLRGLSSDFRAGDARKCLVRLAQRRGVEEGCEVWSCP